MTIIFLFYIYRSVDSLCSNFQPRRASTKSPVNASLFFYIYISLSLLCFQSYAVLLVDVAECKSQVDALKHISEVACDLRNNHTPTNASEPCPKSVPDRLRASL